MEVEKLITYKNVDVFLRMLKEDKFQVGFGNKSGLIMWLKNGIYDNIDLAVSSGMEYARIEIDNFQVAVRKKKEV